MKLEAWIGVIGLVGLVGLVCGPVEVYSPEEAPGYVTNETTSFFVHGPQQQGAPGPSLRTPCFTFCAKNMAIVLFVWRMNPLGMWPMKTCGWSLRLPRRYELRNSFPNRLSNCQNRTFPNRWTMWTFPSPRVLLIHDCRM